MSTHKKDQKQIGLTRDGVSKLKKVTGIVTNGPRYTGPPGRPSAYKGSPAGFWAKITGRDGNKYSWTAQEPQSDGSLIDNEDWGTGDMSEDSGYAVEATADPGVQTDSIQWLYPAVGQEFYYFKLGGGTSYAVIKTNGTVSARSGTTLGIGGGRFYSVATGVYTLVPDQTEDIGFYNRSTVQWKSAAYLDVVLVNGVWMTVAGGNCEDIV